MSSVGNVSLDLSINDKKFRKQVDSIGKNTKAAFNVVSIAVGNIVSNMVTKAVSSIGTFVTDSIEKGSDLAELQNVVDTVFTSMSDKVEDFSKNALKTYGLTESQAKKMMGTYGAMSRSFKFTEKQAYDMSESLTALTADVASFYNLDHDQAYTKMKSVFTGETESLKELGVVMTQTALDEYALANGFGKTVNKMTEQEKVSLRLAFVQQTLNNASGDFAKTQGQWANQVRILTGQFESLKAALGQGFIAILTPIIRALNALMGRLVSVAEAFKSLVERITGQKQSSPAAVVAETTANMDELGSSTEDVTKDVNKTTKAAKALKREIAGFDKITKLAEQATNSATNMASTPSASSMSGGPVASTVPEGEEKKATKFTRVLNKLKEAFKNLGNAISNVTKPALKFVWEHFLKPIGKFAGKVFLSFLDKFADGISWLAKFINKHQTLFQALLTTFTGLFVVSKVSKRINGFRAAFRNLGGLTGVAGKLTKGVGKMFKGFKLLFSPQGLILVGIVAAVAAGIYLYKNWDKVKVKVLKIVEKLKKKFEKAKGFFKKVKEWIVKPFKDLKEKIAEKFKGIDFESIFSAVTTAFSTMILGLPGLFLSLVDWSELGKDITEAIGEIKAKISAWFSDTKEGLKEKWDAITSKVEDKTAELIAKAKDMATSVINGFKEKWDSIKDKGAELVASAKDSASSVINGFKDKWDAIKSKTSELVASAKNKTASTLSTLKSSWSTVKEKSVKLTATAKNASSSVLSTLKSGWSTVKGKSVTLKATAKNASSSVLSTLKSAWNTLSSKTVTLKATFQDFLSEKIKSMWNGIAKGINKGIDTINKIPGVNIGKLDMLAQGGYVKANSPRLAVIGDNKTQGEIVAPENKLEAMARKAAQGGSSPEVVALLREIASLIRSMNLTASVSGNDIANMVVKVINNKTMSTGRNPIIF